MTGCDSAVAVPGSSHRHSRDLQQRGYNVYAETEDLQMPKKKTNPAFLKMAQMPLKPSPQLAEILGSPAPISRPQVAKKVWAYIKKHKLQDPKKRREIVADEKLKPVFGKARLDMFQMTKAISKHLKKID
jgi:upstream activation factor subunit UAF30